MTLSKMRLLFGHSCLHLVGLAIEIPVDPDSFIHQLLIDPQVVGHLAGSN
jgi:hypothetical protein